MTDQEQELKAHPLVRNLVMLVVMLARRLPKEDMRRERARDFLVRHNLMPSPLRERAEQGDKRG